MRHDANIKIDELINDLKSGEFLKNMRGHFYYLLSGD